MDDVQDIRQWGCQKSLFIHSPRYCWLKWRSKSVWRNQKKISFFKQIWAWQIWISWHRECHRRFRPVQFKRIHATRTNLGRDAFGWHAVGDLHWVTYRVGDLPADPYFCTIFAENKACVPCNPQCTGIRLRSTLEKEKNEAVLATCV